jgi:hypothetical protein
MVTEGRAPQGLFNTIIMFRTFFGSDLMGPSNRDRVLCLYPIRVNKSATLIDLFLGQLDITEKLTLETSNSPTETGEQLPLWVTNLLANSNEPALDNSDLLRFTCTPNSEQIFRYSSTTTLCRDAESSPSTAYSRNHFEGGIIPLLQAAHCHKKW